MRDLRLSTGMSLRELARQANVSASFISQIENDKSQPSVATLYVLAQLLNVSVDEFFGTENGVSISEAQPVGTSFVASGADPTTAWRPSEYANRISVEHPSHRPHLDMAAGVVWERLAATPEKAVNFMKVTYAPGASSSDGGSVQQHEGYEYGYVLAGEVEITIGGEIFVLREGESLGFDSRIAHTLRNVGTEYFEGIWFVHGHSH
ncbi:helix-turn-helix domain-containing protein [Subtercola sp. PAMC28395]|uniref:cupin domain-containing protein n=1 Tax=Subtercola sp. PAMC28395 TaxID=2846775 RepID=UPI001C0B69AA|nr:cupin domain-containing protein [Subtercola sp. PAMC28395]QWT24530.1 helix-turn-helix domain-containing protein [Subtercola sp. PAMC28395]